MVLSPVYRRSVFRRMFAEDTREGRVLSEADSRIIVLGERAQPSSPIATLIRLGCVVVAVVVTIIIERRRRRRAAVAAPAPRERSSARCSLTLAGSGIYASVDHTRCKRDTVASCKVARPRRWSRMPVRALLGASHLMSRAMDAPDAGTVMIQRTRMTLHALVLYWTWKLCAGLTRAVAGPGRGEKCRFEFIDAA